MPGADRAEEIPIDSLLPAAIVPNARVLLHGLDRARERPKQRPPSYQDGERLFYLGRRYELRVLRDSASAIFSFAKLERGRFTAVVGAEMTPREARRRVRDAMYGFYWVHAGLYLMRTLEAWCNRLRVARPRIGLTFELEKAWAGTHKPSQSVYIDPRIMQAPRRVVDWVIAHEVVHLLHHDHSPAFHRALSRLVPDHRQREAELRSLEHALDRGKVSE